MVVLEETVNVVLEDKDVVVPDIFDAKMRRLDDACTDYNSNVTCVFLACYDCNSHVPCVVPVSKEQYYLHPRLLESL